MLKKMLWIGLTGGIASGKSTVAKLFKSRGVPVIDADVIARQVVSRGTPGLTAIVARFGSEVVDSNGELDRKSLGRAVFKNPKALLELENILHPLIQQEVIVQKEAAQRSGADIAVYDVPLLFEKNLQNQFDGIVTVVSSLENQMKRMKLRDHLSDQEISERLAAQKPLSEKAKNSHWVINNDSDLNHLESQFESVFKQIQSSKT